MTHVESNILPHQKIKSFTKITALYCELVSVLVILVVALVVLNWRTGWVEKNPGWVFDIVVAAFTIPTVVCSLLNGETKNKVLSFVHWVIRYLFWVFVAISIIMIIIFLCVLYESSGESIPSWVDVLFANLGIVVVPAFLILVALFFFIIPMVKDDGTGFSTISWALHWFYLSILLLLFIDVALEETSLRSTMEQVWLCEDFHPHTYRLVQTCKAYDKSNAAPKLVFLIIGLLAMLIIEIVTLLIAYYYQFFASRKRTSNLVFATMTYPICGGLFFAFSWLAFNVFKVSINDTGISGVLSTFIALLSITYLQKTIEWCMAGDATASKQQEIQDEVEKILATQDNELQGKQKDWDTFKTEMRRPWWRRFR